jgi:DNA-binding response OmpR family regulator
MRELIARVRAMLRRRDLIRQTLIEDTDGADGKVIEVGMLRLDPDAYALTLANTPIDLTRTEFAFLHLLLRNPGRVFSRNYLLNTVWGENYVDGDRSVDNTVLRLRKKLSSEGDNLETVWGVGYRWKKS